MYGAALTYRDQQITVYTSFTFDILKWAWKMCGDKELDLSGDFNQKITLCLLARVYEVDSLEQIKLTTQYNLGFLP